MPDYVPIQDLTIVGSIGNNDLFPLSDGSGAYAVRGSTIKSWAASDAAAAAADAADAASDAAASKTAAQNAATSAGNAQTAAEGAVTTANGAVTTVNRAIADFADTLQSDRASIARLAREATSLVSLPFTLTEGYYVSYSNGELVAASSSNATNYIDISAFDHIRYKQRITTSNPTASGLAFYDEDKTYITGTAARSGQSVGYVEVCLNIPTNAVYVRCTTIADTETYGDFAIAGYSEAGRRFDVAVNGVGNANAKLFTRITDITYELGGIVISNGDNFGHVSMPSYVRNAGFLAVRAGSTVDVDPGYKFSINLYTLDDTPAFIAGKSATFSGMFTVPFDCNIKIAISDTENTSQSTTAIAAHFKLNLYGMDDALEDKFAALDDVMYSIDSSEFAVSYGGISAKGVSNAQKDKLRYTYKGLGAFAVKAGSTISANTGFKFGMALYTSYNSNSDFELLGFVGMRNTPYTVQVDCFIRIMFAAEDDSQLWTNVDGEYILTATGEAAVAGAINLNLYGGTVKEEIQNLSDRSDIWHEPFDLSTEIPLNAIAYHLLFADLVDKGYLTQTLIGKQNDDNDYPIYLYTMRHDMAHIDPNYAIIPWNGNNELYQRPKIWMDSGIHGNERTTPYALWDFINKLCTKVEYQEMRNAFDWYFVPLVNPWGFSNTAYKNGVVNNGNGYTSSTISQYTIAANTESVHQGIRRNPDGIDINRDFGDFLTDEAQWIKDTLDELTEDGRNFIVALDAHQATGGDDVNVIGAFLSLNYSATAADKALIWSKWMQAGAMAEMVIANNLDREVVQSVYPWDGTNLDTARNYMAAYADYSMCFEGGQACIYYSQNTVWSNPVARTLINTVFHGFLHKLTEHWM